MVRVLKLSHINRNRTAVHNVTLGVAFFEPKEHFPSEEDVAKLQQSLNSGKFDLDHYLFGSSHNRHGMLSKLISDLQSESPFNVIDTPSVSLDFPGHPRRLVSLDKIMDYITNRDIKVANGSFDISLSAGLSVRKLRDELANPQQTHPSSDRVRAIQNLAEAFLNRFNGVGTSAQNDLHRHRP